MANSVLVGKEATHGTTAASFRSVACAFMPSEKSANDVPVEVRNSQDSHFHALRGVQDFSFEVRDSYVYHDTIGLWLASAFGLPTVTETEPDTVFDNAFTLKDDPASLSFKYTDPRRAVDPLTSLWNVVDKLVVSFKGDGALTYTASGVGMPPTTVAAPTFAFSDAAPVEGWRGAVTLDGASAYAKLVSGQITVTRNRKPFHPLRNNRAPSRMTIGARTVEFELVVDFANLDELTDWRNAVEVGGLLITWSDSDTTIGASSHPEFEIGMGTLAYENAEKDWGPDEPQLKLSGKGLYTGSDASSVTARVQSTTDYSA